MTGIFVRVEREGHWTNAEFDQLTDAEMQAFVDRQIRAHSPEDAARRGWAWAMTLAQWIRDHVETEARPHEDPP